MRPISALLLLVSSLSFTAQAPDTPNDLKEQLVGTTAHTQATD
ncbi:hypothetical protein [Neolewinella sp.]